MKPAEGPKQAETPKNSVKREEHKVAEPTKKPEPKKEQVVPATSPERKVEHKNRTDVAALPKTPHLAKVPEKPVAKSSQSIPEAKKTATQK